MDLVFKLGRNFGRLEVISADLIKRFNLCLRNKNIQSKYCLISNFPSKIRWNYKSLPNKATIVSKMHLFPFNYWLAWGLRGQTGLYVVLCWWLIAFEEDFPCWFCPVPPECNGPTWMVLVKPSQGAHTHKLSGTDSPYLFWLSDQRWWINTNKKWRAVASRNNHHC